MIKKKKDKLLHDLFIVSITIRGIDGVLDLIGGIVLMFLRSDTVFALVQKVFHHELTQDPTDAIANHLIQASQHISISLMSFISLYLIIHGLVKIGIFSGLWFKRMWAYPLSGVVLSLFLGYQLIRLLVTHSIILAVLMLADISIILLLRSEYKRLKKSRGNKA